MKKRSLPTALILSLACLTMAAGCKSRSTNVWDENKTSAGYKGRALKSPWGREDAVVTQDEFVGPNEEEFIPLRDEDLKSQFADGAIPQPKHDLGDVASGVPGYDQFRNPSSQLASIFKNLFFETDAHVLRGAEFSSTVEKVASYLKANPNTLVIVEGHCDERGPEAYNLSLGAKRANFIRSALVQRGVNQDQVHTISYGKEKPLELGHNTSAWNKNRRAQFKIHQK
jgi:peptidoglycan-associated lipoprotein